MTKASDTLADLVSQDAARGVVLDRLGLDYCCSGEQGLEQACANAGLDVADVVAQLDSAPRAGEVHDCAAMDVSDLVDHLLDVHHVYLHAELPDLDRLAQKVLDVHGGRHSELHDVRTLVTAIADDLEPHMMKEERVLFPVILGLAKGPIDLPFGTIDDPIRMMCAEHERVGELLARLRDATRDYRVPDDACASYRALYERLAHLEHDTHMHVFEENHLLFPRAATLEGVHDTGGPGMSERSPERGPT